MTYLPDDWAEIAWAKLPVDLRKRAVERLQAYYDPSFFEEVRKLAQEHGLGEWLPDFWHFGQGMAVRNILRSDAGWKDNSPRRLVRWSRKSIPTAPILDEELPGLPEIYDGLCDQGNWDDYYVQCIEAAAGLRDVE